MYRLQHWRHWNDCTKRWVENKHNTCESQYLLFELIHKFNVLMKQLNIKLSDNKIGETGAAVLSEALKLNRGMKKLSFDGKHIERIDILLPINDQYIKGNKVGSTGSKSLSEGLKANTTLTKLSITCNEIHSQYTYTQYLIYNKQGVRLEMKEQSHLEKD